MQSDGETVSIERRSGLIFPAAKPQAAIAATLIRRERCEKRMKSEQNDEECDARDDDQGTEAGKIIFRKNK